MIASAVLLLALAATTAEAQQQPRVLSMRVAKSMPTAYRAPDCGLKSGHFKVSSGASYLKTGIETDVPDNQQRALDSGVLVRRQNKLEARTRLDVLNQRLSLGHTLTKTFDLPQVIAVVTPFHQRLDVPLVGLQTECH